MKIIYLCTYFHQALLYRQQMDGLYRMGHIVKVFNSAKIGDGISEKFLNVIDNNVIHVECWKPIDRILFFPRQLKIEKNFLKNYNPKDFDLLHSHLMLSSGWTARRIKKKYQLPYVVSVRATDLMGWIKLPFFHKMAIKNVKEANGILFLSKSHKDEFINKFIPKNMREDILKKSVVIGNPLELFWQLNTVKECKSILKKDCIKILTVARINKVKNILMAVKSVELLISRGYKAQLTVVGDVEDEKELKQIQKFEFVKIISFSKREKLKEIYKENHIFLLPSLIETFGRVYIEAMSQGLPILYSKGQGFDNIYPDGIVGYSVNPTDSNDICNKIELIISNYEKISNNCIIRCKDFYEDEIINKIDSFYKKALN